MTLQKIVIVFESYHHQNTEKIAQVIAQALKAELYKTEHIDMAKLLDAKMIGIGTGIYFGKPHRKIQKFLAQLPFFDDKKGFLFIISGIQKESYNRSIRKLMESKGLQLIDYFSCKGFASFVPLKIIGGINKGSPDLKDLYEAEIFANTLLNRL